MKRIVSVLMVGLLPVTLMVWVRAHQSSGFAAMELIAYPLLFGGGAIVVILALHRFFLAQPLSAFNSGTGSIGRDLVHGVVLAAIYFGLFFLFRATLADWLEFRSNTELLGLMLQMREHWWMLLLWFGPVLWIGIALFEEIWRVFLLNTLWGFANGAGSVLAMIFLVALLFGLAHWSQGSYGIVTITLKGLVSGLYFFRYRRLFPLVLAHVLYDGLQVGMLLATYPE